MFVVGSLALIHCLTDIINMALLSQRLLFKVLVFFFDLRILVSQLRGYRGYPNCPKTSLDVSKYVGGI